MIDFLVQITTHVLESLYYYLGVSIIATIVFMVAYLYIQENGIKYTVKKWKDSFNGSVQFRKMCVLVFYVSMILFRTLLGRSLWYNPLSNVLGVWGLYREDGTLYTENIENMILFVPFTVLFLWIYKEKMIVNVKVWRVLIVSLIGSFIFSLAIEAFQLFLHYGTFQLSDLFYNTLGGLMGGLIYWCGYKITHCNKRKQ